MGTVKVFDKSETLGRLSVVVIRAVDVTQLTEPREEILKLLWPDISGDVSYEQRLAALISFAATLARGR